MKFAGFGEAFIHSEKKFFPMLVATFILKGWPKHVIFLVPVIFPLFWHPVCFGSVSWCSCVRGLALLFFFMSVVIRRIIQGVVISIVNRSGSLTRNSDF